MTFGPGTYGFRNDTANDLFQSVHFGGVLGFDLNFSGAADPLTRYVSHFAVSAFDADGVTALGNYDPVTGAYDRFVERFVLTSWSEYVRLRTRMTVSDRTLQERVEALQSTDVPLPISRLIGVNDRDFPY